MPADNNQDPVVSFGPFRLFPKSRLLEKEGEPLHVGGRALDILIVLAERPGEVIDKRELVKRIWADVNVDEGSLRFHVAALRKVLGDTGKSARYVLNVPGRGYCFVASSTQPASPVAPASAEVIPPRSLPAPLAKMIGREEMIEKISNGVTLHRFTTVVGPGGIGKTVVAVTVGHRRSADFGGRVYFVDFGPLRDAGHVTTTIASVLGLTVSSEDPTPAILTFLKTGPALLIFDGCEHVLDTLAPLVEQIVREAPQLRVLATSRESFRSEGERIFRLFPLDCPPEREGLEVADVLAYPAAQLFVERIAQSSGPFQLSAEDAPLVASICRRLDGIALAIEPRGGACQCVWHRRHGLAARQPLLAAMARTTHGRAAPPDARCRPRLELRPAAPGRKRDIAAIVGFRRPLRTRGGRRGRIRQRPQRRGDAGGDRQPGRQIADLAIRLADAALSPARHHAHLRARQAERGSAKSGNSRSAMPSIFATSSSARAPTARRRCRTG